MPFLFVSVLRAAGFVCLLSAALLTWGQAPISVLPVASSETPVQIAANLDKPIAAYKPIFAWFGYDEANYTTMQHGKELLRELRDLTAAPDRGTLAVKGRKPMRTNRRVAACDGTTMR